MRDEKEQISVFDVLAKREGVSPDEMHAKIAARIQEGLHDPDSDKRAAWEQIPHAGEIPTPEEYVHFVVEKLEAEGLGHLLRWYPDL